MKKALAYGAGSGDGGCNSLFDEMANPERVRTRRIRLGRAERKGGETP